MLKEEALDASTGSAVDGSYQYDAFICYRRRDGTPAAEGLRHKLIDYRLPKGFPQRSLRIYLDRIYEHATEDFFVNTIQPALASSRALIVVQTPSAAATGNDGQESWVTREVRYFRTLPQRDRVWVALAIGDFADPLPADLQRQLPNVERVDIRPLSNTWGRLSEHELLKFVGPLQGVPTFRMPDLRRETERRMRARVLRWSSVALVVICTLVTLSILAVVSSNRAAREALRQRSVRLAADAERIPAREYDLAFLLAVEGYRAFPSPQAARTLLELGTRNSKLYRYFHCPGESMAFDVAILPRPRALALLCGQSLRVFGLEDGIFREEYLLPEKEGARSVLSIPGRDIVILSGMSGLRVKRLGLPMTSLSAHTKVITTLAANRDGTLLASADDGKSIRLWDVSNERIDRWTSTPFAQASSTVAELQFDGDTLRSDQQAWSLGTGKEIARNEDASLDTLLCPEQPAVSRYRSPRIRDAEHSVWAYANNANDVVVGDGKTCQLLPGNAHNISSLKLADDGARLLLASAGQVGRRRFGAVVWDLHQHHPFASVLLKSANAVAGATAVSADGRVVVVAGQAGVSAFEVSVDTTVSNRLLGTTPQATAPRDVAVNRNGDEIALIDWQGGLRRFRIGSHGLEALPAQEVLPFMGISYDRTDALIGVAPGGVYRVAGPSAEPLFKIQADATSCPRVSTDGTAFLFEDSSRLHLVDLRTLMHSSVDIRPFTDSGTNCSGLDGGQGKVARVLNTYGRLPLQVFEMTSARLLVGQENPITSESGLPTVLDRPFFSPARGSLAVLSRGDRQALLLWDLNSPALMGSIPIGGIHSRPDAIEGYERYVNYAMSEQGNAVVLLTDKSATVWVTEPGWWASMLGQIANRLLQPEERRDWDAPR